MFKSISRLFLIILVIISFSGICSSETTSIPDEAKWNASVEGAMSIFRGNSNYTEYQFSGSVHRVSLGNEYQSTLIYNKSKTEDRVVNNSIKLKNEFEYSLGGELVVIGTADYERDLVKHIELRANSFYGIGLVFPDKKNKGGINTSIGMEYQDTVGEEVETEATGRSSYKIKYSLSDDVDFNTALEVTYRFSDLRDFRFFKEASLKFKVTKRLYVKTGFEIDYRNIVSSEERKWDTKFLTSLVLEF